jgi:tetratricopeptide (TPR) repeat protein
VRRGNEARQAGRLRDALDSYRKAASLQPEHYQIRVLIGDTLRRMGRADEALAEYDEAVRIDPARPEGYTGRALLLRAAYRFDAAVAAVEPALERITGRERADLLISMGETRRHQGRAADAAALFAQALEIDPDRGAAYAGQARLAEERGDLDAAIDLWGRCIATRPEDGAAALRSQELRELRAALAALDATLAAGRGGDQRKVFLGERARLLAIAGDARAAAAAWRAVLRLDPKSPTARRGLALALVSMGDDREAAGEFRRLLRTAPDDGVALYHLAGVARRAGDLVAEEAAWTTLVERRPGDMHGARALAQFVAAAGDAARRHALAAAAGATVEAARRRALLLADAGDWDGTAAALGAALAADPTDPWTLDVAQDILARRPELLGAIAARAQAASAAAPDDPLPLLFLARCAAFAGREAEVANLVHRAARLAPDAPLVLSALGEVLLGAVPDPGPGLAALRRAVDADPGRVAASVDLSLALLRAGRVGDAETAARRGLERHPAAAELLALAGTARAGQGDLEGAARDYATALVADPADNFHLARGQLPLVLAGLGRGVEARRALAGDLPEFPEQAYDEAWSFARDTSRDRRFNGQDWNGWRARGPGRTATPADAHRAIAVMLASLGDPYARLRNPEETAAVFLTRHGGPIGPDRLGRQRPHARTVVTEDLPGNLGYIQITNLADPNAVAEVRRALMAMREKEGIVLDLRGNPGGLARSADAVADMLIGPGKEAGIDVTPAGAAPRVTGGDGAVTDRPVTVLVDGQTGSAAERLAGSLDAAGRATVVGEPTLGKGTFQTSRVLPGGYTVLVSAGEGLGPDGRPIQGRGLQPRSDASRSPAPRAESPRPGPPAPDPPSPGPR